MALQGVANVISAQAIRGIRMCAVRYGPIAATTAATTTEVYVRAADASRQFKRDSAIASEDPLTEDEYRALEENNAMIWGGASDFVEPTEPRPVRVCYQIIRACRNMKTTGFNNPIPRLSHWSLEVGGNYYELREHKPDNQVDVEKRHQSRIVYEKLGLESRKIKLSVTTDRILHPSAEYCNVGVTTLSDDKIIWAASLVFGRFSSGYDLMIDNCQHFTQLLAEAICGIDNKDDVRKFFDDRSFMKLPVAASWLVAPVYGCTKVLYHALEPDKPDDTNMAHENVGKLLNSMENFVLHPRVYAARRRLKLFSKGSSYLDVRISTLKKTTKSL